MLLRFARCRLWMKLLVGFIALARLIVALKLSVKRGCLWIISSWFGIQVLQKLSLVRVWWQCTLVPGFHWRFWWYSCRFPCCRTRAYFKPLWLGSNISLGRDHPHHWHCASPSSICQNVVRSSCGLDQRPYLQVSLMSVGWTWLCVPLSEC